jgi:hypothetical protein
VGVAEPTGEGLGEIAIVGSMVGVGSKVEPNLKRAIIV